MPFDTIIKYFYYMYIFISKWDKGKGIYIKMRKSTRYLK